MRKTHEVLRLHFDLKLKQRQIARSANLSQSTVPEYLRRFTAAGLSWPLPEQMSEAELEAALFSADAKPPRAPARNLPDFSHILKELQEHKHVTLQFRADAFLRHSLLSLFSDAAFLSAFPPVPPALLSYPGCTGPRDFARFDVGSLFFRELLCCLKVDLLIYCDCTVECVDH